MDDVAAIVAIERASETAPHWPIEEYCRLLTADDGPVKQVLLFAEDAGFAVGRVLSEEAEIESVAVLPEARRQGTGRALCAALITWARQQGAVAMALEVRSASQGARRLYEGLGFTVAGLRPGYYRDPNDDAVLMRLDLQ